MEQWKEKIVVSHSISLLSIVESSGMGIESPAESFLLSWNHIAKVLTKSKLVPEDSDIREIPFRTLVDGLAES